MEIISILADSLSPKRARLVTFEIFYSNTPYSEIVSQCDFLKNAFCSLTIPTAVQQGTSFLPAIVVSTTNIALGNVPQSKQFFGLVQKIQQAIAESNPTLLHWGDWHLPYVTEEDKDFVYDHYHVDYSMLLCQLSASRCAQYLGNTEKSIHKEILLGKELLTKQLDYFEHVATPWCPTNNAIAKVDHGESHADLLFELTNALDSPEGLCPSWVDVRNFRGWRQARSFLEHGDT